MKISPIAGFFSLWATALVISAIGSLALVTAFILGCIWLAHHIK